MLFNSLRFLLIFMPLVLATIVMLRGRALLIAICVASGVFYAYAGHAWFLLPMAVTTVLDYWVGRQLGRVPKSHRRAYLLLSLTANLGLLAFFKYSALIGESATRIAALFGQDAPWATAIAVHVVLPAGISFYTFQTMSYVIDIYRGKNEGDRSFFAYLAFVSFFPHLVAGPLTRHDQLIPQLHRIARDGVRPRWWFGISQFSIGLAKKVLIADRIGNLVDLTLGDVSRLGAATGWIAAIGYGLQIYFDFSGYSDMAVGLGRLFSIELPQNFNSPYKSKNPSEFWRRWHITLSEWLRDYLYISLGGNRHGAARVRLNLLITMFLGGLWHGASWTFAIWGIYHGLLLVLYQWRRASWDALDRRVQQVLTFGLVTVGWVFFRAPTLSDAGVWLGAMVGRHGLIGSHPMAMRLAVLSAAALAIAWLAPNAYEMKLEGWRSFRRAALGLVTAGAVVLMNYSSKFLYFQF